MSNPLSDSERNRIDQAIDDFKKRSEADNLQPGTPEWEAAVEDAIETHQIAQRRNIFKERLDVLLPKKKHGCIRDEQPAKCKQGPWYGAKCNFCNKKGKLGTPDKNVPATR